MSFPFRPVHPVSVCIVFLGRQAASDALVDPDAVLRPSVGRFPESFPAQVRDYPSAAVVTAWQGALQAHPELRLRVEHQKAAYQPEPLAVALQVQPVSARKALQVVVLQEQLWAVQPVTGDESV